MIFPDKLLKHALFNVEVVSRYVHYEYIVAITILCNYF